MPDYLPRISQLKERIETGLKPLIDNHYVLLDLPLYNNIGDVLIWQGTLDFLRTVPFRRLAQGCLKTWNFPDLQPGTVILLSGGGNFGDLYPHHQNFRLRVIERYPEHRIIILPQSIHYEHSAFLKEDMESMRRHSDLWICARDRESSALLCNYLPPEHILLLPDMAFCIDPQRLVHPTRKVLRPALFIERVDRESVKTEFSKHPTDDNGAEISSIDIRDWPGFVHRTFCQWLMVRMRSCRKIVGHKTVLFFADRVFRPHMFGLGVRLIGRYEHIYTTRLHAAILAVLLGKEVTVLDNTYRKNSRFFKTWFADSGIEIIENRSTKMPDQEKTAANVSARPANRPKQTA